MENKNKKLDKKTEQLMNNTIVPGLEKSLSRVIALNLTNIINDKEESIISGFELNYNVKELFAQDHFKNESLDINLDDLFSKSFEELYNKMGVEVTINIKPFIFGEENINDDKTIH